MTFDLESGLARAKAFLQHGRTLSAAKVFEECLSVDPLNLMILAQYVPVMAEHDRSVATAKAMDFIQRLPRTELQTRVIAYELLLPYLEAQRRTEKGQSSYSSDDLHQHAFENVQDELAGYGAAIHTWAEAVGDVPPAICSRAYFHGAMKQWPQVDHLVRQLKGKWDPRVTAVRFSSDPVEMDLPDTVQSWHEGDRVSPRVMIACDPPYWQKFGSRLLHSFARSGTDALFHLHVYDMTQDSLDSHLSVFRRFVGDRFVLTSETLPAEWRGRERYYYASARFPRVSRAVAETRVPYIVLDTDLMITANLGVVFDRLRSCDVMLCRMPGRLTFHTQMNASFSAFSGSDHSVAFARRVSSFVSRVLLTEQVPWCLDQISLHCVFRQFERERQSVTVTACGPKVYNGLFDDDVLLWPQKCTAEHPQREQWARAFRTFSV